MKTRTFDLRTVLSVTTGRLLTKSKGPRDNGIDDMYKLLNWMTGDSVFTHQLGRFGGECKPWLYRWYPELKAAESLLPQLDAWILEMGPEAGCAKWVDALGLPATFDVPRVPQDDHERKDPVKELVEMRGTDDGVIVVEK